MKIRTIKENKYWIWLSLIKNIGSIKKQKLLKRFKTPKCIYNASELELLEIEGIGENTARSILKSKNEKQIENNIIYLQENNIKLITIEDEEYPKNLKQIYDYQ